MDVQHINNLCNEHLEHIIRIRRNIHQHPELANREFETSLLVQAELKRLGIEYHTFPDMTAVMGIIRGSGGEGGTVGLRADMDALPLSEQSGLPFSSQNPGVMHACGHDAHTAILLGTAAVLQEMRDCFSGSVKLFFQPAEEADGGSRRMIAAGCMEDPHVDAVFGLHVEEHLPAGTLSAKKGGVNACSDRFFITVHGKKSHGASPAEGVDAIYVASLLVTGLYGMCSRRVAPFESVALNVGTFHGGEAANIICDEVTLNVMFRTLDQAVRERLAAEIEQYVRYICAANGAGVDFIRKISCDSQINDSSLVDRLDIMSEQILGPDRFILSARQSLGTEDFCYFGQAAPSVFYYIGSGAAPGHGFAPAHSSEFTIDETCLSVGMRMQAAMALDTLERLKK